MFFWEIYEIFRTGFRRNTCQCRLPQLVVTGKYFNQKIFFKNYLIRFDVQWHFLLGIKCITEVWRPFTMFILVCSVHFSSCFIDLDKQQRHKRYLNYTYSQLPQFLHIYRKIHFHWASLTCN